MELDDDVVDAARSGDHDAFARIYQALSPRVLGYLRSRGAEDPEGLTSEVFLGVFRRIGEVHGGASGLQVFVFSIAHARGVDQLRQWTRRPDHVPYDPEYDDRHSSAAEDDAIVSLEAQRALRLLHRLNDDQRAVVSMRVVAELSLQETAEALDKSVASVKQLQRRGLLALRTMLTTEVAH